MDRNATPLVLTVEDDPLIARLIVTMLGAYGYQTCVAPDAAAAALELRRARPALVTLDLNLPGLSGGALLKQLRGEPHTADLPVVLVTAQAEIAPDVRGLADAVLLKPFGLDELLAVVRATLAGAPPLAGRPGGAVSVCD